MTGEHVDQTDAEQAGEDDKKIAVSLDEIRRQLPPAVQPLLDTAVQAAQNVKLAEALQQSYARIRELEAQVRAAAAPAKPDAGEGGTGA